MQIAQQQHSPVSRSQCPGRRRGSRRLPEKPNNVHRLAREFLRGRCQDVYGRLTIRNWGGGWWRYERNHYRLMHDDELRAEITRSVQQLYQRWRAGDQKGFVLNVTNHQVSNVINALKSLPDVLVQSTVTQPAWLGSQLNDGRDWIALKNQRLDLSALMDGGQIAEHPHTPEWFSTVCLPYDYNPQATCDQWLDFLSWMFDRDQASIQFVQEWFGYCLVQDTSLQRFVIVEGPGANGKSVLLETLEALVGKENCSSVALEDFRDRFALSPTVGKLVNIVSEIGDVRHLPEATLKAFVAGESMSFDRKFQQPLQVNATARLVFATNRVPEFADRSEGVWRRLIILPTRQVIAPEQQDPDLPQKLRQELPGIFDWAVQGLGRLRQQRRFTEPEVVIEARQKHREACDPVGAFLAERVVEDPNEKVMTADLMGAYQEWADEREHPYVGANQFGKGIKLLFPAAGRKKLPCPGGKRSWGYKGLKLVPGVPGNGIY